MTKDEFKTLKPNTIIQNKYSGFEARVMKFDDWIAINFKSIMTNVPSYIFYQCSDGLYGRGFYHEWEIISQSTTTPAPAKTKAAISPPEILLNPDFEEVINCLQSCIDDTVKTNYWKEDNDHYIFVAVINSIFKDTSKFYTWLKQFDE